MTKKKHIHKLMQVNGKYVKIFKCAFPDCTFVLNHGQFEILLGRYCICNGCNEKFIMTEDSLNEDLPKCINCKFRSVINSSVSNDSSNNHTDEVTIEDLDGFLSIKGI